MKYRLNLFAIFLTISIGASAQVHVDKRNTLPLRRCDAWDFAMNQQLGVIGNDWYGIEYLGTAPAENLVHQNAWWPITYNGKAYRRTVKGRLLSFFRRTAGFFESDDDFNFIVQPDQDALFEEAYQRLKSEHKIGGEIDLPSNFWGTYNEYTSLVPKQELDNICLYGPWVHDAIDGDHNYLEIHPIQQLWWTTICNGLHTYHLNLFQDASKRFDRRSQYEEVHNLHFKELWVPNPAKGVFSIAFEAPLRSKTREFEINVLQSQNVIQNAGSSKTHYLIYKNDTLVKLNVLNDFDYFKIKFDSVALDASTLLPNFNTGRIDSAIKGFIVIEAAVEKRIPFLGNSNIALIPREEGFLIFNVEEKNIPESSPGLLQYYRIDVTLDSIKCVAVDDHDDAEDLFGYLGVRIISGNELPLECSILSTSNSNLFWSRLDGDALSLKKNQISKINKTLSYILSANDSLIITGDLDEDDDNGDDNPNDRDGENHLFDNDDLLGGVKHSRFTNFGINRNRKPIQVFRSGGTDIWVYYTIKVIEISPASINNHVIESH